MKSSSFYVVAYDFISKPNTKMYQSPILLVSSVNISQWHPKIKNECIRWKCSLLEWKSISIQCVLGEIWCMYLLYIWQQYFTIPIEVLVWLVATTKKMSFFDQLPLVFFCVYHKTTFVFEKVGKENHKICSCENVCVWNVKIFLIRISIDNRVL